MTMAKPDIEFATPDEELNYGVRTLLEAGFTAKQIDQIRNEDHEEYYAFFS